jgi:predicted RNA-binding protein YlxR (DUF448 family)
MRTCVGCRRTLPQSTLVRCVLTPEGVAVVSRHAAGRGAWLCSATCFAPAVKRKGFERAWRRPVPVAALDELPGQIDNAFESTTTQMREWTVAGSASGGPTPTKG